MAPTRQPWNKVAPQAQAEEAEEAHAPEDQQHVEEDLTALSDAGAWNDAVVVQLGHAAVKLPAVAGALRTPGLAFQGKILQPRAVT